MCRVVPVTAIYIAGMLLAGACHAGTIEGPLLLQPNVVTLSVARVAGAEIVFHVSSFVSLYRFSQGMFTTAPTTMS